MIVEESRTVQDNFVLFSSNPDYSVKYRDKTASYILDEENMDCMSIETVDIHNTQETVA